MHNEKQATLRSLLDLVGNPTVSFRLRDEALQEINAMWPAFDTGDGADFVRTRAGLAAHLLLVLAPTYRDQISHGLPKREAHEKTCVAFGRSGASLKQVRTDWAMNCLVRTELAHYPERGVWAITDRGKEVVRECRGAVKPIADIIAAKLAVSGSD